MKTKLDLLFTPSVKHINLLSVCILMFILSCQVHAATIVGYSPDVSPTTGMDASAIDATGSSAEVYTVGDDPTQGPIGTFGCAVVLRPSAAGASGTDAITNGDFFQFTLTAQPGNTFDLTSLSFGAYKGGSSGPRGWALTSSADGFSSIISESIVTATPDSPSPESFFVDLSSYTGLSTITLRMYVFSPYANFPVSFKDFIVDGTVDNDKPTADLVIDGGDSAMDIGNLNVSYLDGIFTVDYSVDTSMDDLWEVVETHVYIGDEVPQKSAPGKLPYQQGEIEFTPEGDFVYIAAYAEVRMDTGEVDEFGDPIYLYEGVWAQADTNISIGKGTNWSTCFIYVLP